jgi:hypothetical protein
VSAALRGVRLLPAHLSGRSLRGRPRLGLCLWLRLWPFGAAAPLRLLPCAHHLLLLRARGGLLLSALRGRLLLCLSMCLGLLSHYCALLFGGRTLLLPLGFSLCSPVEAGALAARVFCAGSRDPLRLRPCLLLRRRFSDSRGTLLRLSSSAEFLLRKLTLVGDL